MIGINMVLNIVYISMCLYMAQWLGGSERDDRSIGRKGERARCVMSHTFRREVSFGE